MHQVELPTIIAMVQEQQRQNEKVGEALHAVGQSLSMLLKLFEIMRQQLEEQDHQIEILEQRMAVRDAKDALDELGERRTVN